MNPHVFYRNTIATLLILAMLNLSCNYYLFRPVPNAGGEFNRRLLEVSTNGRYLVLHNGMNAYAMKNVAVDTTSMSITCIIDTLPREHLLVEIQNVDPEDSHFRYNKKKNEQVVLDEVHLYSKNSSPLPLHAQATIPISSLVKMDIVDKNNGATTASYVFATLGIIAGVFLLVGIIAVATKSSCPFVYSYDGDKKTFEGEIYGGAIYPSLERDDYLLLNHLSLVNNRYQINISNELKEKQYTNLAELMVIEHDSLVKAMVDDRGNVQTIADPQSPASASLDGRFDYTHELSTIDKASCLFNDEQEDDNMNDLYLTFQKPSDATTAKLVLNGKNSLWLDYMYGEFTKLTGSFYNQFVKLEEKAPPSQLYQWMIDQGIPLLVSIKTDHGWQPVDTITAFGPLATRDLVVPIDISGIQSNKLEVKLTCGFMFWEIDYAGMDYSKNVSCNIKYVKPEFATDERGKDVSTSLSFADNDYLSQPSIGNTAIIKYHCPITNPTMARTTILHTRGYYVHVRDYSGIPKISYLKSFQQPGAFTAFSKQRYLEMQQKQLLALSQ